MPPRKSDVRASTPIAAEETSPPAKPQQEKKDKDKEKEKDAQKAKGEDAITIEVCVHHSAAVKKKNQQERKLIFAFSRT